MGIMSAMIPCKIYGWICTLQIQGYHFIDGRYLITSLPFVILGYLEWRPLFKLRY